MGKLRIVVEVHGVDPPMRSVIEFDPERWEEKEWALKETMGLQVEEIVRTVTRRRVPARP